MGSERISDVARATWQVSGRARLQPVAIPAGLFPLSGAIPDVPEHCTQTTMVTPKPLHVTVPQLSPKPP